MLDISKVSVRSFAVGLRWARRNNFPHLISDWTEQHSKKLQEVCEEYDRRQYSEENMQ